MTIKLHNTRTHKKEVFAPIDPDDVRMYVCGPTVYDHAHLGNARPVVVFDVLFRLLRHVYRADHVTYVRNFTDVDDKINTRAAESGRTIDEITDETIKWFLDDMATLGAQTPTHMPRATQYIPQMVTMIETLIRDGHAYEAEGHVLFSVDSWPAQYGALSGRSVKDMIAGARVEVAPYKKNPMDFVLWKPSTADLPGWESPWGRGRPGWHIECSAMAFELLGDSFDIHGGGIDLMFPHHENEIAQSCCAHPDGDFAKVWMHNEMLQVEGKKMSKSLGNFFTVRDLLEKGVPGEVIRFVFLSTHYRKPMDWTEEKAEEAAQRLFKWRNLTETVAPADAPAASIVDALADDLNTALAITELHRLEDDPPALLASARLMGLLEEGGGAWHARHKLHDTANDRLRTLLKMRQQAKETRDFQLADKIRDDLASFGVTIKDLPGGNVTPSTSFEQVDAYYSKLPAPEKSAIFGDTYGPDGGVRDVMAAVDCYLSHVAALLLQELGGKT